MLNFKEKMNGQLFFSLKRAAGHDSQERDRADSTSKETKPCPSALLRCVWLGTRLTPGKESSVLFGSLLSRRRGLETFYVKPNCACRDAIDSRKAVHEPTGAIFPALNSHFGLPVPGIAAIHRLELVLVNTRRLGRIYRLGHRRRH